jgi:hypothetical protein
MKANFLRKACSYKELKDAARGRKVDEFVIEAVVELEKEDYANFTANLLNDFDFIAQHVKEMRVDCDDVWHCILVKAKGAKNGVLLESEGHCYGKYAAYYAGR